MLHDGVLGELFKWRIYHARRALAMRACLWLLLLMCRERADTIVRCTFKSGWPAIDYVPRKKRNKQTYHKRCHELFKGNVPYNSLDASE